MKLIWILILLFATSSAFSKCTWCISEELDSSNKAESFLDLSPQAQLAKVENEGIKVFILDSGRKSETPFFQWKSVRVDSGNLTDISKVEGSLGKTLCKGERPLAIKEFTIILSSDAPLSTLLHEYLHVKQIKKDSSWCLVSKRLWSMTIPLPEDIKIVRDHEWDVRKILWSVRNHKSFNVEDHIVIAEGMLKESEMRKNYDPEASLYVKKEKVQEFLASQIIIFQQFLLNKAKKQNE